MRVRTFSILFLLFSLCSVSLFAQDTEGNDDNDSDDDDDTPRLHSLKEDGEKNYYVFSTRLDVTVPKPIGNNSFRRCFVGVYEVSGGINVMLYKGVFIGGTAKTGMLKITENKIANYNASMSVNNLAGKIGGDLFLGDRNRVLFSVSMAIGNNWTKYSSFVKKDPNDNTKIIPIPNDNSKFTSFYYEPEVNLFFLVDENFGVGGTLTYSIFTHTFDPYVLSLDEWAPFDKTPSGNTTYLSFGFGVYYNFLHKKK